VNVASRIEPLARPGGICVTGEVLSHVRNKVPYPMVRIENAVLKNIREKIDVYALVLPWEEKGNPENHPIPNLNRKRVAVLPLVSLSPDPNDEYFADGITEELISTMSNITGLQVISRTSVMQFKRTTKPMAEIAKELGAGSILEGSVRRAGDKVRVTAQLIDTNADAHIWAKSYDRVLQDIFAIQSDISMNIAGSLKVQLIGEERERLQKSATNNSEAHLLYLKGRYFWNERTKEGLEKALNYFHLAIDKDPEFGLAYSGIADTLAILSDHGYIPLREVYHEALKNAETGVRIDPSLSETHASLGLVLNELGPSKKGTEELRKAIEINPNNAYANMWYSLALTDPNEALPYSERAARLDPLNLQVGATYGETLRLAGRLDDAIHQLEKVVELGRDFAPGYFFLSQSYLQNGQTDEAVRAMSRTVELRPHAKVSLGYVLASVGRKEEAVAVARELEKSGSFVDPADMAWLYEAIGEREKALGELRKSVAERSAHLVYFARDPLTKKFREDPEVRVLMDEAGYKEP